MIQYEEREKIKRMPTSAHTAHSRDIDKNSARDRGKIADFSVFAFLWYKNIHSQFSVQHTSLSPVYPFVHIPHRACGISGVRRRYLCSTCTRKVFNSICSLFYCCVLWIRYSVSCLGRTIARSHNNKQTKYETRKESEMVRAFALQMEMAHWCTYGRSAGKFTWSRGYGIVCMWRYRTLNWQQSRLCASVWLGPIFLATLGTLQ